MADLTNLYDRIEAATSPYQILGVSESRNFSTVKSAYRALVLVIHPDKCHPGQAELHTRLFVKVHAAYETLCNNREKLEEGPGEWPQTSSPFKGEERKAGPTQDYTPEDDFFESWAAFCEECG